MTGIYFKATWCSACRTMFPTIQKLQKEGYNIQIVDTDEDRGLANQYKITSLPTLVILKDTKEIDRIVGNSDIEDVRKRLKKEPDYKLW